MRVRRSVSGQGQVQVPVQVGVVFVFFFSAVVIVRWSRVVLLLRLPEPVRGVVVRVLVMRQSYSGRVFRPVLQRLL